MKRQAFIIIALAALSMSLSVFLVGSKVNADSIDSDRLALTSTNAKLTLNHSAYAYNSKGIRLKGKKNYFKKGKNVIATDKLRLTNKVKRYYIEYDYTMGPIVDMWQDTYVYLYWLPYKTIKKQEYYRIGKNRYIKCGNIEKINGYYLCTNQFEGVIHIPVGFTKYDGVGKKDSEGNDYDYKKVKLKLFEGQKVILDERDITGYGVEVYHLKGTKYYIYRNFLEKQPRQLVSSHPIKTINAKSRLRTWY